MTAAFYWDFNHRCAQDHGAGEVSYKVCFFTYSTLTISWRIFLGNRESFFVSCYRKQFACTLCMKESRNGELEENRAPAAEGQDCPP